MNIQSSHSIDCKDLEEFMANLRYEINGNTYICNDKKAFLESIHIADCVIPTVVIDFSTFIIHAGKSTTVTFTETGFTMYFENTNSMKFILNLDIKQVY